MFADWVHEKAMEWNRGSKKNVTAKPHQKEAGAWEP